MSAPKCHLPFPLRVVLMVLCALLIITVGYILYILISYSRIDDNVPCETEIVDSSKKVTTGEPYTAITQNIGFGAYSPEFTFFMDGGTESWAKDENEIRKNINAAIHKLSSVIPDFLLIQEVDFDSTRSYHIDEKSILTSAFSSYNSTFAVNYHSAFLIYPFTQPHGSSNSGLLTFSKYNISEAVRRSLPISESFSKPLDLDRCYTVNRIPVDNGKELIIYNVHLSAYGGSDEIRTAQMNMLLSDIKAEYDKGNYCVCGGDFNHDFTGNSTQLLNQGDETDFGWAQPFPDELIPKGVSRCLDYSSSIAVPTCRNCDIPYEKGNFTVIVDGFLVSDNIEVLSVENMNTDFAYSDHNPVKLVFKLTE